MRARVRARVRFRVRVRGGGHVWSPEAVTMRLSCGVHAESKSALRCACHEPVRVWTAEAQGGDA